MITALAIAAVVLSQQTVMPSDTPPALPIPAEALANLKSREDIIAASRLANGAPAPATLVMPHLRNRTDVLRYMIEHYPPALRGRADFEMPWAWMFVDSLGRTGVIKIVRSSGSVAFDSLALASLRIARFDPALVDGDAVAVWVPMPVQIAYEDLAAKAPPEKPEAPTFTPYTVKPNLVNRSEVVKALVQNYPKELRSAGVGGQTLVWVLLNENGDVVRSMVKETSGNAHLDDAALMVARIMKFTPARNRDKPVKVWIVLPIVFKSR